MRWRRSISGYQWAAAALVVGLLAGTVWYFYALTQTTYQVNDFERVPFGGREVELDRGTHTLWLEGDGVSATRFAADGYRAEMLPHVTSAATGDDIAVAPIRKSQVFNTGPREGRSLWTFDVPAVGGYRVVIEPRYRADIDVPGGSNVAIGAGVGLRTPIRPWTALLLIAGVATCVAAVLVTVLYRRRDLRRHLTQTPPRSTTSPVTRA